jgi:hypothetical protein
LKDFRPVNLEDREFFQLHYSKYPIFHSDYSFTNIICWNHYAHYQFAYVNSNLILSSQINGVTRFRPPIGPKDVDLLKNVIKLAESENNNIILDFIENETANWIKSVIPSKKLEPDRDQFDYVYRTQDLATLPNRTYQSIRHELNKFKRKYTYHLESISPYKNAEIKEFLNQWYSEKKVEVDPMLVYEKKALLFCIDHYEDLKIDGLLIRINGEIGAISIFDSLNENTAIVHFEKGLTKYSGIYKAINAETALILAKHYQYINREGDLGNQGLRIAKTRYHPYHMVMVYKIHKI